LTLSTLPLPGGEFAEQRWEDPASDFVSPIHLPELDLFQQSGRTGARKQALKAMRTAEWTNESTNEWEEMLNNTCGLSACLSRYFCMDHPYSGQQSFCWAEHIHSTHEVGFFFLFCSFASFILSVSSVDRTSKREEQNDRCQTGFHLQLTQWESGKSLFHFQGCSSAWADPFPISSRPSPVRSPFSLLFLLFLGPARTDLCASFVHAAKLR